jgi:hypothetical protein
VPTPWAISPISERMRSTVSRSAVAKAPTSCRSWRRVEPVLVELVARIAFEEGAAGHAVALGEAKHLAAERHQPAVVA